MDSQHLDIVHFWGFCLWFLIGLFFPDRYLEVLAILVGWEMVERLTMESEMLNDLKRKYWILPEKYWKETELNQYADVIIKMLAYIAASKIASVLRNKSSSPVVQSSVVCSSPPHPLY